MRRDACATLKGQIAVHQGVGDSEMAAETEAVLQDILSKRPAEVKPLRLNWKELADTVSDLAQLPGCKIKSASGIDDA